MIDDLLRNQTTIFGAIVFGAIMLGVSLERWRAKVARNEWRARKGSWNNGSKKIANSGLSVVQKHDAIPAFDAAEQLRRVMSANFVSRPLLNRSEARLFTAVECTMEDLGLDWRLMAQVSLGEILSSPDKDAYFAINSKRVDMLIVNKDGMPLHAIEYQGGGHHQGTAAARDAVKKVALRRAGIGYIEVSKGDTPAELRLKLAKLSAQALMGGTIPPIAASK